MDKTLDRKVAMTEALDLRLVASPSKYPKLAFRKQGYGQNYPKKRTSRKKMLVSEPVDDSVVAKCAVRTEKNCDEVIDTMNLAFSFEEDVVKFNDVAATDFADGEPEGGDVGVTTDVIDSDVRRESSLSPFCLQVLISANNDPVDAWINGGLETETLTFSSIPNGDSKEIPGRSFDLETESYCDDLQSLCRSIAKDCTGDRNSFVSEAGSLSLMDRRSIADVSCGLVEAVVAFNGSILPTDHLDLRKNGMSSSTMNVSLAMNVETQDTKTESHIGTDKTHLVKTFE